MLVTCESAIVGRKTGKKKDGKDWYLLSIQDLENDRHLNFFVSKRIYDDTKDETIYRFILSLTYNLKTKQHYVSLKDFEVI